MQFNGKIWAQHFNTPESSTLHIIQNLSKKLAYLYLNFRCNAREVLGSTTVHYTHTISWLD